MKASEVANRRIGAIRVVYSCPVLDRAGAKIKKERYIMFYLGMVIGVIVGVVLSFIGFLVLIYIGARAERQRPKQNVEIRVGGETMLKKEIEKP